MKYSKKHIKRIENLVKRLKDDHNSLKEMLDLLPVNIYIRDYEGTFIYLNDKYAKEYDKTVKELLGKNIFEYFKKLDQAKVKKFVEFDREVIDKQIKMKRIESGKDLENNKKIFIVVRIPFGKNKVLGVMFDIKEETLKNRELNKCIFDSFLSHEQLDELIEFASGIHRLDSNDINKFWKELLFAAKQLIPKSDYGSTYINKDGVIKYIATLGHDIKPLNELKIDSKYFKEFDRKGKVIIITKIIDSHKGLDFSKSIKEAAKPMKESITFHIYLNELMVGGISLDIKEGSEKSFDQDDKKILELFLSLADYFYKSKQYSLIKDQFTKEVTVTLTKLLEFRDKYTKGHSQYVAALSKLIAEKMGLSRELVERTYWAGLLHDIGKISIPDRILNKPGKLTIQEYNLVKKHPQWSYKSINASEQLEDIAKPILYHHERWDGKGYPEGLESNDIPLISQIIGLADSWNAMISKRVYRDALSESEALKEIKKNKGTQFSPDVADVLIAIVENNKLEDIDIIEDEKLFLKDQREENQQVKKAYFEVLFDQSEEAIVILDEKFRFVKVNDYFEEMFGFKQSEIQGVNIKDTIIPKEKLNETGKFINQLRKGEIIRTETYRQKKAGENKDGKNIDVSLQAFPITLKAGNIGYYVIYNDITELKDVETKYENAQNKYRSLFYNGKIIMLIIDPEDGKIVDANPAAEKFYNWSKKELTSMKVSDINMLSKKETKEEMENVENEEKLYFNFRHKTANEEVKDVEVYSQPIKFGEKDYLYSVIHDVTSKIAKDKKIEYLEFHDILTKLYNRRYFMNEIGRLNKSRRIPISIITADIRDLKKINDKYGHKRGNKFIKKAAWILKKLIRKEDILARIGNDEFGIILPETGNKAVVKKCKTIKTEIGRFNNQKELVEDIELYLGCATMESKKEKLTDIFKKAEDLLGKDVFN